MCISIYQYKTSDPKGLRPSVCHYSHGINPNPMKYHVLYLKNVSHRWNNNNKKSHYKNPERINYYCRSSLPSLSPLYEKSTPSRSANSSSHLNYTCKERGVGGQTTQEAHYFIPQIRKYLLLQNNKFFYSEHINEITHIVRSFSFSMLFIKHH